MNQSPNQQPLIHHDAPIIRKLLMSVILLLMALLVVYPAAPQASVMGQSSCLLNCQQGYVNCIQNPNPPPEGIDCENRYNACVEACLSD